MLPAGRHRRVTPPGVAFRLSNSSVQPSAEADAGCFENLREDRPESVALAWAPRRPSGVAAWRSGSRCSDGLVYWQSQPMLGHPAGTGICAHICPVGHSPPQIL